MSSSEAISRIPVTFTRNPPRRKPREPVIGELRDQVFAKTRGHCWYCGGRFDQGLLGEVDHVKPVCRGGSNHIDNLVPACHQCNVDKGMYSLMRFRFIRGVDHFWGELP